MIQMNLESKHTRSSVFCDTYAAAYNVKSDTVVIIATKGNAMVHTQTVTREDDDVVVEVMYFDPNIADRFNTKFTLKSLFPRKKAA